MNHPAPAAPPKDGAPGDRAAGFLHSDLGNAQLLKWMFRFLKPVPMDAGLACLWLIVFVVLEIRVVRYFGSVVDQIKHFHLAEKDTHLSFWQWFGGVDADSAGLRHSVLVLSLMVGGLLLTRYLREVSRAKFSMRMVYYIREAVYDKLDRKSTRLNSSHLVIS